MLSQSEEVSGPAGKEKHDDSTRPTTDVAKDKVVVDEEKGNEKQAR